MQHAQIISDSVSAIDGLDKEGETIDASFKTHRRERRPALGRKQARFCIKPDGPSYSKPDTHISLNIDDIDDPVEYFKAVEKQLEAEKEMQKLRGGVVIDVTQQDQGRKTRKRRPGLSERRAVYRHYISEEDAMAETLAKIQEKHHEALNYSSSLINSELVDGTMSQIDNKNNKPQEPELEGRENNEFDHLLATLKDLDDSEVESYLREMLHLKPIDVCKINLPALPNRTMHVVSEHQKILSSSIRSPPVSVSTFLKKRLSNLWNDILSFPEEDAADSPDSSSSKSAGSSPVVEPDRVIKPSWNSHPLPDKNTSPKSIGAGGLQLATTPNLHSNSGPVIAETGPKWSVFWHAGRNFEPCNVQHGTLVFDESDTGVRPHDSQPNNHEVLEDASHLFGETTKDDSNAGNKDSNVPHANGHLHADGVNYSSELQITNEPDARDEIQVPNAREISNSETDNDIPPPEVDANLQMPDVRIFQGNSHPPEAMDSSDQASENQHFLPDTDNEHQIASQTPSNELGTQKAPLRLRKRKINDKRHSLAGAGTFWEDGRRKISRRKFKPLEHWRGERLLLGRIHDSLPTVIGVKYASPGKKSLKVESYVSAEFDDLLNIAANC